MRKMPNNLINSDALNRRLSDTLAIMLGTILISKPPSFKTFQVAHRIKSGEHRFEVAYGSSFSELCYDFTLKEFLRSADRSELEKQLNRVGADWLVSVLLKLASATITVTTEDLQLMAVEGNSNG
jgi:hypothetical protein